MPDGLPEGSVNLLDWLLEHVWLPREREHQDAVDRAIRASVKPAVDALHPSREGGAGKYAS